MKSATRPSSLVASSPSPVSHEWVRWLNSGCCQGDAQESLHPNAYGEKAIGKCIALSYAADERQLHMPQHSGADFNSMFLQPIS